MAGHSGAAGKGQKNTVAEIAAMWDAVMSGHQGAGSFGAKFSDDADKLRDGADPAGGKIKRYDLLFGGLRRAPDASEVVANVVVPSIVGVMKGDDFSTSGTLWSILIANSSGSPFSSNQKFVQHTDPLDFKGETVKDVQISLPITVIAQYSDVIVRAFGTLDITTKVELMDGVTVVATWTLPASVSGTTLNTDDVNLIIQPIINFVAVDRVFTDMQIRVTINTTLASTVNLNSNGHIHNYLGFMGGATNVQAEVAVGTIKVYTDGVVA